MNVGSTNMDVASQYGIAAFEGATKTQASAAMKLIDGAAQQGAEMNSQAQAEQGKGLNINTVC